MPRTGTTIGTRRHDTRRRLLDAACDAILEHGSAATTRQITRGAGLSDAALYVHFESKHDLFRALLRERLTTPSTALRQSSESPERLLMRYVRQLMHALRLQLPLAATIRSDPVLRRIAKRELTPTSDGALRLVRYITKQQTAGAIDTSLDAPLLAQALISAACYGAWVSLLDGENETDPAIYDWIGSAVNALLRRPSP